MAKSNQGKEISKAPPRKRGHGAPHLCLPHERCDAAVHDCKKKGKYVINRKFVCGRHILWAKNFEEKQHHNDADNDQRPAEGAPKRKRMKKAKATS